MPALVLLGHCLIEFINFFMFYFTLVYHSSTGRSAEGMGPVGSSLALVSPRYTTAIICHSEIKYCLIFKLFDM